MGLEDFIRKAAGDDLTGASKGVIRLRGAYLLAAGAAATGAIWAVFSFLGIAEPEQRAGILVTPAVLALLGLLLLVTGLPLRRLSFLWNELSDGVQRVIVYGIVFGGPILLVWYLSR